MAAFKTSKPIIDYIDLDELGIDRSHMPTMKDFNSQWASLDIADKSTVKALLTSTTFKDFHKATGSTGYNVSLDMMTRDAMIAFYFGVVVRQETDAARSVLIRQIMEKTSLAAITHKHIEELVMSDKGHLQQLADQLRVDGDGKRGILKELVAYGMQSKKMEAAQLDEHGDVVAPAVYGLADPKVAFGAVQELNKMDHEYGENDKATSSIESQAARVRRLAQQMDTAAKQQAEKRGGIAKEITPRDIM
jgi:hypothetical protein